MTNIDIPKKGAPNATSDWLWSRIKAALEDQGMTMAALSRKHGKHRTYFTSLKTLPIPRAQKLLARELRIAPWEIWPSRYDSDRLPGSRIAWLNANIDSKGRLVQNRAAA